MRIARDPQRCRNGFALLMTLVLVMLAGVSLAAVARHSMAGAVQARADLEALQYRWAVESCRATLLGRSEHMLQQAEFDNAPPPEPGSTAIEFGKPIAKLRVEFELADQPYELIVTDEQAKLNVNALLEQGDRHQAAKHIRKLVRNDHNVTNGGGGVDLHVLFEDVYGDDTTALNDIGGYGQLFDTPTPSSLIDRGDEGAGLADRMTCWGDGLINLHRAPVEVLVAGFEDEVSIDIITQLIAQRDRYPYAPVMQIVEGIETIDDKARAALLSRLTDRSLCHGLWVIGRGEYRIRYSLVVGESVLESNAEATGIQRRIIQRYRFNW